jgi:hypothetical protein
MPLRMASEHHVATVSGHLGRSQCPPVCAGLSPQWHEVIFENLTQEWFSMAWIRVAVVGLPVPTLGVLAMSSLVTNHRSVAC